MAQNVELRPARPEDHDFALSLYLDGIREHAAPLINWDEEQKAERFSRQWRAELAEIILVEGEPAGFLMSTREAATATLQQLYVVRALQGQGIGSAALDLWLARWRGTGLSCLLAVLLGSPAQRLY